MYRIVYSKTFARNLRKLVKSGNFDLGRLHKVINSLATGRKLTAKLKDHKLKGDLDSHRECHVASDLLLIYEKIDDVMILHLLQLGTHSNLFK